MCDGNPEQRIIEALRETAHDTRRSYRTKNLDWNRRSLAATANLLAVLRNMGARIAQDVQYRGPYRFVREIRLTLADGTRVHLTNDDGEKAAECIRRNNK